MKYCKHLKKRKNKPYCNLLKQEITLSRCQQCVNKEYRVPVKGKIENRKKSTVFVKNGTFGENLSPKNAKKMQNSKIKSNNSQIKNSAYSLHNSAETLQKMKNKSNKLANLERKRFSVFTANDRCMVCKSTYQLTWNEIYRGRNRINSMKYGFCLRMCLNCHKNYQDDVLFNKLWHENAQRYFEEHYGTRDEFVRIFRRNYLN